MIRDMRTTNIQRGFSLLETIISIVALSFISVFILEMYMSAANLSNRARNIDIATTKAVTAIEDIKKHTSLNAYLEAEDCAVLKDDGFVSVNRFFDEDWQPLALDADLIGDYVAASELDALQTFTAESANAYFHLNIEITAGDAAHSGLYEITAQIADISRAEQGDLRNLVTLGTKKYFARGNDYEKDDSGE